MAVSRIECHARAPGGFAQHHGLRPAGAGLLHTGVQQGTPQVAVAVGAMGLRCLACARHGLLSGCHRVRRLRLPTAAEGFKRRNRRARGFGLCLRSRIGGAQQAFVGLQDFDETENPFLIRRKRCCSSTAERVHPLGKYSGLFLALDQTGERVFDVLGCP